MPRSRETETAMKIQLILTMVLFGTIGLFVRNIQLPSSIIALTRGSVGALCLMGFLRLKGGAVGWASIRRNARLLFLAGAAMGFNWILLFEAYRYTTVAAATLAYYLAPVMVILVSAATGREALTLIRAFCALLALGGMVLVSGVMGNGPLGGAGLTGLLLGTGAAALYASVVLLNRELQWIKAYDATMTQLAIGALVLLPYALLTSNGQEFNVDGRSLIFLAIVAVVHTGIAYVMYFSSLQVLTAQTVAIFSYLDPLVAVLVSGLILHEALPASTLLGGALILSSTFLSEAGERREALAKAEPDQGP